MSGDFDFVTSKCAVVTAAEAEATRTTSATSSSVSVVATTAFAREKNDQRCAVLIFTEDSAFETSHKTMTNEVHF